MTENPIYDRWLWKEVYQTTFITQEKAEERLRAKYRERYFWDVTLVVACGYNPQRLLTDQRSSFQKFIGDHVLGEPYDLMMTRTSTFANGGTVTGRSLIPMRNEFVWPKWNPGDRIPHLFPGEKLHIEPDYSETEDRVLGWGIRDRVKSMIDVHINVDTKAFDRQIRLALRMKSLLLDRAIQNAVLGIYIDSPEPVRERRILKLLRSKDPRQRKRGDRLYAAWDNSRPGYNHYRKD